MTHASVKKIKLVEIKPKRVFDEATTYFAVITGVTAEFAVIAGR